MYSHLIRAIALVCLLRRVSPDTANANERRWINAVNNQLLRVNELTAYYSWELTVRPTTKLTTQSTAFNAIKSQWTQGRCSEARQRLSHATVQHNGTVSALERLLCRGPRFSEDQTIMLTQDLYAMQTAFVGQSVCVPRSFDVCRHGFEAMWRHTFVRRADGRLWGITRREPADKSLEYSPATFRCFSGEPEMDRIMAGDQSLFHSEPTPFGDCVLDTYSAARWAWEAWRHATGQDVWIPFRRAIAVMNAGARQNGYTDIGAVWREELDLPKLPARMADLWRGVQPLYTLLHAVLRNALWHKTQRTVHQFERHGPIPAHMLASMWSQNWTPYLGLLMPGDANQVELAARMQSKRWTAQQIVEHADDFYASVGLPRMSQGFWRRSVFDANQMGGNGTSSCHGTAANMYRKDDVRMIFCVEPTGGTLDDVYVAVHEMGHIQYFLGYMAGQPPVFQDGQSALQEAIGDAMHLGFTAPQHLHRIGLISDEQLMGHSRTVAMDDPFLRSIHGSGNSTDDRRRADKGFEDDSDNEMESEVNAFDLSLLLRSALSRIAQIPFEYLLDVYRWDLFAGRVQDSDVNSHLWHLIERYQGVGLPDGIARDQIGRFDAGAKYHVADNTPFARYFLASFLQAQIFRGLCETMIYGKVRPGKELPMPLHRCDIYGSKRAGKLLKKAFAMGTSQPWTEALYVLTGYREVRVDALMEYYRPLNVWLSQVANEYSLPIGW